MEEEVGVMVVEGVVVLVVKEEDVEGVVEGVVWEGVVVVVVLVEVVEGVVVEGVVVVVVMVEVVEGVLLALLLVVVVVVVGQCAWNRGGSGDGGERGEDTLCGNILS